MASRDDNFTMKEMLKMSYDRIEEMNGKIDNAIEDVSQIKIHLKEQNGNVKRNVRDIARAQKDVDKVKIELGKLKLKMAAYGGAIGVVAFVASLFASHFF